MFNFDLKDGLYALGTASALLMVFVGGVEVTMIFGELCEDGWVEGGPKGGGAFLFGALRVDKGGQVVGEVTV
jgi:hypothetical protein